MRRSSTLVLAVIAVAAAAHAACVGEDPDSQPTTPADGGLGDTTSSGVDAAGNDAGTDGGALVDGPCDLTKDFGAPDPTPFVNINRTGERDDAPYLLPDELTVYFSSPRPDGDGGSSFEIYRATRSSLTAAFGVPERVPGGVNEPGLVEDLAPVIAPDDKTIFWTRAKAGVTAGYDGYYAQRADTQSAWGAAMPLALASTNVDDGPSAFVKNELWYEADGKLYHSTWAGGSRGTPTEFDELGPGAGYVRPTADGLRIYYATTTAGSGHDIWTARRATFAEKFTDLEVVNNVNSNGDEFPGWISPDGCRLYMQSNRTPDAKADLYVATKPR